MVVSDWDRPLDLGVRRGDPPPQDIPAAIHIEDGRVLIVDVRNLLPEGSVVVDRARFERLRQSVIEGVTNGIGPAHIAHLEPGDLDPLPE